VRWGSREVEWTYVPEADDLAALVRPMFAEALGMMAFVFAAGAAIIINTHTEGGLGLLGMGAATAAAFAILVLTFHPISGGHLNPGITLGMVAAGRMPPSIGLLYGGAQLGGAVLGALLLEVIFRDVVADSSAAASLFFDDAAINGWTGALLEGILTFLLVVVYFRTFVHSRDDDRTLGALTLGGVVLLAFLVAYPLTGAAMNVARVFGTDLVAGEYTDFGYYALGLIGGAVAGLTYRYIFPAAEEGDH
jgi:aquaporin Z